MKTVTVLDIDRASVDHVDFDAVISLIDHESVLEFKHPNHHVEVFHDEEFLSAQKAPQLEHIERILEFTSKLPDDANVLVHCHAGMCRSTAVAIAIEVQQGKDAVEAAIELEKNHFKPCWFYPNRLVLRHAGVILKDDFLSLNVNRWMQTLPYALW